jgi:hypothetical protein
MQEVSGEIWPITAKARCRYRVNFTRLLQRAVAVIDEIFNRCLVPQVRARPLGDNLGRHCIANGVGCRLSRCPWAYDVFRNPGSRTL